MEVAQELDEKLTKLEETVEAIHVSKERKRSRTERKHESLVSIRGKTPRSPLFLSFLSIKRWGKAKERGKEDFKQQSKSTDARRHVKISVDNACLDMISCTCVLGCHQYSMVFCGRKSGAAVSPTQTGISTRWGGRPEWRPRRIFFLILLSSSSLLRVQLQCFFAWRPTRLAFLNLSLSVLCLSFVSSVSVPLIFFVHQRHIESEMPLLSSLPALLRCVQSQQEKIKLLQDRILGLKRGE